MSERRFVIVELSPHEFADSWITESELKKRIGLLRNELTRVIPDYNEAIDILLHGEGKEEPVPQKNDTDATGQTIGYVNAIHAKPIEGQFYGKPWPKVHDVEEFYKEPDDQPSPTPTRAEWEAWKAFERELGSRYHVCPSNAPADSILLAVLNAVATVVKSLSKEVTK